MMVGFAVCAGGGGCQCYWDGTGYCGKLGYWRLHWSLITENSHRGCYDYSQHVATVAMIGN